MWASPTPFWPDPQSWTPDGRIVVFTTKGADTHDDIWILSLQNRHARPWLQTPAGEWGGRLSPDGRLMAYSSNESGLNEVYVQPFREPGIKRLASEHGGTNPIWSRDGRELFYRAADNLLVVGVETDQGFTVGKPTILFSGRYRMSGRDFDVSPDGKRFVMLRNESEDVGHDQPAPQLAAGSRRPPEGDAPVNRRLAAEDDERTGFRRHSVSACCWVKRTQTKDNDSCPRCWHTTCLPGQSVLVDLALGRTHGLGAGHRLPRGARSLEGVTDASQELDRFADVHADPPPQALHRT